MFTRWTIGNFKSIREPVTLELAPLTIFSGINSSGKSTLIQSILMVSQSLASSTGEEALVLNGHFAQLGEMSDVCHYGLEHEPITLGFKWEPTKLDREALHHFIGLSAKVVKGARSSQLGRRADTSWPTVRESSITFMEQRPRAFDRNETQIELSIEPAPELKLSPHYRLPVSLRQQIEGGAFNYTPVTVSGAELLARPGAKERVARLSMNGLLPQRLLVSRSEANVDPNLASDAERVIRLLELAADNRRSMPGLESNRRLSPELIDFFQEVAVAPPISPDIKYTDIRRLQRFLSGRAHTPLTLASLMNELITSNYAAEDLMTYAARLRKAMLAYLRLRSERADMITTFEARLLPPTFSGAVDQIREIARHRVHYLGPLRDDPRVIYQIPPHTEQWSVGLKGEYTAAILDEYTNYGVSYPMPPDGRLDGEYVTVKGRLSEAVTVWLKRMGLVDSLDTEETPKIGYRLTVTSPGLSKALDLTSVGVGVSQVLPTLVQALLAPAGSILIFEQPELHLHPKVQSVLGDFFLGMAQLGKQCIVETHSEHLINRLRRRIVEAQGQSVLSQIRIYFAEKEGAATRFRPVEPNEYGAILDWPEGFFDQAEFEASLLLREQLQKRRRAADSATRGVA